MICLFAMVALTCYSFSFTCHIVFLTNHSIDFICGVLLTRDFISFIGRIVLLIEHSAAGLGGSVGCAVRLETRRSRVQPPPRSATFFRGD